MLAKKCIIDTTETTLSQMIAYIIKAMNIGITVREKKGIRAVLEEVDDNCELFVIFDPHTFTFELEKVCKKIFSVNPETVLICVCRNSCNKYLGLRLYRSGVNCVISDLENSRQLDGILKNAFARIDYYPTEVAAAIRKREHILMSDFCTSLTEREIEVLYNFAEKKPAKLIAKMLHITESTVSTTLHRVLKKLGVETKEEAVALIKTYGFVTST